MNKLTLDVENIAVDSFETGLPARRDCPTASATATVAGVLSNATSGRA